MGKLINGWFSETSPLWPGWALSLEIEETLYSRKSKYQEIDVYRTKSCGTMLVLDGVIQATEFDESGYQEMLTHIPIFAHSNPERVLVIGGGDGGILREAAKHSSVKEIDICEIDEDVINVSKKFLPSMACGFSDPRVSVHIMDGSEFIKNRQQYYDVIIVDSSDPVGPAETLFKHSFYEGMKTALRPGGMIATQAESIFFHKDIVKSLINIAKTLFPVYGYAVTLVPTYPGGNIGICIGSLGNDVKTPSRQPDKTMKEKLKYYSPEIHRAAFVLPAFGKDLFN
ncbi:MAG: spermidine synthase [Lentisphaerae bacterium GWF2_45_14]|nr:MAG: spermidine synthase [Lentisphaerae bacterium GWF2_45_14]